MTQCVLFYGSDLPRLSGIVKYAGPYRVASELRANGFETQCIDVGPLHPINATSLSLIFKIAEKFITADTIWVGLSTTFFDNFLGIFDNDENFKEFLNFCKNLNPKIKFVSGGSKYYDLRKYGFYIFKGNADYEIVEFTKQCIDKKYKSDIVVDIEKIVNCKEFNKFTTSKINWTSNDIIFPHETLPIEISRGCIFKCKFCAFPMNGKTKGEWVKQHQTLYEELIYNYETYGITSYQFADDTYNDSVDKIRSLHENVFSKLPFKMQFTTYLRLDLMMRFPESIDILKESGLKSAIFGIETNVSENGKAIGKGVEFNKQIKFLQKIKEDQFKDILTSSGFILGLPYDTKESMQSLVDFLLSDQNPLDHWKTTVMAFSPPHLAPHKLSFSEFDKDYANYGYMIDGIGRNFSWKMPATGITSSYCKELSKDFHIASRDHPKLKSGGFGYPRYASLVPDPSCLIKLSRAEAAKEFNFGKLVQERHKQYYDRILKI